MTNSVISVAPEASLLDVLRLFVEENIHGAPVVDEDGQLQGVVTTSDLLRAQAEEHDSVATTSDYFRGMLEFSAPDWEGDLTDFQGRLANRTVSDVMTKQVLSVSLDTPVSEVARCLREHQVHRVWIEDAGRLCGVVSALDLMPVIEGASATK
jgi:CBS domain-containing protein